LFLNGLVATLGQCLLFLGDFAIVVQPLGAVAEKIGLVQEKIQLREPELLFFQVDGGNLLSGPAAQIQWYSLGILRILGSHLIHPHRPHQDELDV
jgi:hypothetical protein